MRSLVFIFTVIALFIGCTKIPEKTDIEEILNKIEEERAAKCGNGIRDDWEECDFEGPVSCSFLDKTLIGKMECVNCVFDKYYCENNEQCNEELCNGNGICREMKYLDYDFFCECFEGYSNKNCAECIEGYHYDFDNSCLPDNVCTKIGCELENQECRVNTKGYAECICSYPYMGENCEKCQEGYYHDNGICNKSSCIGVECPKYERCGIASDGTPECFCESEYQNPADCSKCKVGYCWNEKKDYNYCESRMRRQCLPNTSKPENSYDVFEYGLVDCINYEWNTPECQWECLDDYYLNKGECKAVLLKNIGKMAMVTPNKNNELLLFASSGEVYKLENEEMKFVNKLPVSSFTDGRILPDGNYYLVNQQYSSSGWMIIMTPDGREIIKHYIEKNEQYYTPTFAKGGKIYRGNIDYTFPGNKKINSDVVSSNIVVITTLTDQLLNTYTICSDGTVFGINSDGEILWTKHFEGYLFYPHFTALGLNKKLYIPYKNSSNLRGLYIFDTESGSTENFQFNYVENNYSGNVVISLGIDFLVIAPGNGRAYWHTHDMKIFKTALLPSGSNMSPILLDNGTTFIYNYGYYRFFLYDVNGTELWQRQISVGTLTHYDNKAIGYGYNTEKGQIFNVPGATAGDWPQLLHDARKSGSLSDISFVDPPSAPVALTPEDSTVFNTNSVTFSWGIDSSDPNIKYTLLLRDSTGYDKVYAGPEIGLSTATVNDLSSGSYEWRVVSKDENGSLNVSDARTFTVE